MTNKWMMGTALATLIVAAPAAALAQDGVNQCLLEEMQNETFLGLDLDDDSGLTMEEYRECLSENDLTLNDADMATFEKSFTDADADADGIVLVAELDTYKASAATDAPTGTITVTQPAAEVVVQQPSPEVRVAQPQPEVAVQTAQPEVQVTTPEPEVEVATAQPTVEVEQGQPLVSVDQPAPEVAVQQSEPQVQVEAGQPAVEVETSQPQVSVEQSEPEVEVTQPELDVNVQQEEAQVAVQQGQAEVAVEQTTAVEAETEVAAVEADAAATAAVEVETVQIRLADFEGKDVMNTAGEEIGSIERIVMDPAASAPVVIVSVGGFLGLGDREIVVPFSDLSISGDDVVMNTSMTEEELEELPEYDESRYEDLPDTMIIE